MKLNLTFRFPLLLALVFSLQVSGQSTNIRGLYVSSFNRVLGNATNEDNLLNYCQDNSINYICLYNVASIDLSNSTIKTNFAAFIKRAKTQYGISQVGVAGEIYSFFSGSVLPYNSGRTNPLEKVDVLNFEFEFWIPSGIASYYGPRYLIPNGYSNDTAGAFAFAYREFQKIDNVCAVNGLISEVYFGWPNRGQMQKMASLADRLLIHAYRPNDVDVYQYSKSRLQDIASLNRAMTVMPIFSSEPDFMNAWLKSNPITKPYATYSTAYIAETGSWKQYINLQGYQWFVSAYMPQTASVVANITAGGATTFCSGGSVTLVANQGSGYTYQWLKNSVDINGATGISYNATNTGNYAVRITASSGSATSTPINVTVSLAVATPIISAAGPTKFCPGESVTLSSSSAASYLWSTGETTQSITVSSAGDYSVTVYSGNCSAVSAVTTVSDTATMPTPIIIAGGPTNFCPGGSVTLSSSSATSYLWSTGETTQSITASSAGNYSVMVYSGNCNAASAITTVTDTVTIPTPTIAASGQTNLCPGDSITLSSSPSASYVWSTGDTTQSITVSAAGNYSVIVYSGNCSAVSALTTVTDTATAPTPIITTSGTTSLCAGDSVTLSSSSATSYLWSTGDTTQSITVSAAGNYSVIIYSGNCSAVSALTTVNDTATAPTPIITASGPTSFCPGDSVTLSSSTAISYVWSTGDTTQSITVSASGNYSVIVYSGNCSAASSVTSVSDTASAPTPIITAIGQTGFCLGDSVTLSSSSATSYLWSTGDTTQSITVISAGNYSVIIYSGNCSAVSALTAVSDSASASTPIITASGSTSICPGSSVILTSSPANSYEWSTGETTRSIVATSQGSYWVKTSNSPNCFAKSANTDVTELVAPATPVITANGPLLLSPGESVILTSTSEDSYKWSTRETTQSITVSYQGSYRVTVFGTNGCGATSAAIIVGANGCVPPPVPVIIASGPTTLLSGQSVTLTCATPTGGWLWSTGAQTRSITIKKAGVYTVRNYNAGYCHSTSDPVVIYVITAREGDEMQNFQTNMTLFPNPAHDVMHVSFNAGAAQSCLVSIYDLSGREVITKTAEAVEGSNLVEFNVNEFPRGLYFVTLKGEAIDIRTKVILE